MPLFHHSIISRTLYYYQKTNFLPYTYINFCFQETYCTDEKIFRIYFNFNFNFHHCFFFSQNIFMPSNHRINSAIIVNIKQCNQSKSNETNCLQKYSQSCIYSFCCFRVVITIIVLNLLCSLLLCLILIYWWIDSKGFNQFKQSFSVANDENDENNREKKCISWSTDAEKLYNTGELFFARLYALITLCLNCTLQNVWIKAFFFWF